jgi:type IV secretion system protein VirB2
VSALIAAVDWLQALLLGTVGTTVAVIAIGIVGFRMLLGNFALRDGFRAAAGIFILFGGPLIARGLMATLDSSPVSQDISIPTSAASSPAPQSPATKSNPFDPYIGRH